METAPIPKMPVAVSSQDRTNETTLTHNGPTPKDTPSISLSQTSVAGTETENSLKSESPTHIDVSDDNLHKLTVEERLKRESSSSDLKLLLNFASSAFAHPPTVESKVMDDVHTNQNFSKDDPLMSSSKSQNESYNYNDANAQLKNLTNAASHSESTPFLPLSIPKKYTASDPVRLTVLSDYPLGTSYAYNNGHPVPLPYMSSSIPAGPDSVKSLKKEMKKTKLGFKRAAAESAKRTWSEAMAISMSSDNILHPDHKRTLYDDSDMSSSYRKKIKSLPTTTTRSGRETKPSNKVAATLIEKHTDSERASTALPTASDALKLRDMLLAEKRTRGPSKIKDRKPRESSGHIRGVTQRPSGKWQAQLYFAGKSRYIGVFDSREKANLGYEIAREYLHSHFSGTHYSDAEKCMNEARKMAFEGVKDFVVDHVDVPSDNTGIGGESKEENIELSTES